MARIQVIEYEESFGRLKEIYSDLIDKRGKLAEVHTIQSLRPESIVKHIDLYLEIMFTKSELSRAEREMMAVVVSKANGCEYCQIHHGEALKFYWKDNEKLALLRKDYKQAGLTYKELQLCEFAESLTLHPWLSEKNDPTKKLREAGLSDSAILDASLVVSYFNFVNRIVLSLDVNMEADYGAGYKY